MRYIITNFAYGTGPYLRTVELALAINEYLEILGKERFGIIVPWVYGVKQKRIMQEEFGSQVREHPNEIFLDLSLGRILKEFFYGNNTYQKALNGWANGFSGFSSRAQASLKGSMLVETFSGRRFSVHGRDIAFEIGRAPRVDFGIRPAFDITFSYISEILEKTLSVSTKVIHLDRKLVKRSIPLIKQIEASRTQIFLAYPSTFSFLTGRKKRHSLETIIPPTIHPPVLNYDSIDAGLYITVTGIPGLERLYNEARKLGLKLYSNDPRSIPGSKKLLPHVVPNPKVKFQFARSGWGSIWLSQLAGTPFVAPDFDPQDDPEIYFNNLCIEKLGLGIIYRGQPLAEILDQAEALRIRIQLFNQELFYRFGTFDGNHYAAKLISDAYLK